MVTNIVHKHCPECGSSAPSVRGVVVHKIGGKNVESSCMNGWHNKPVWIEREKDGAL